MAAEQKTTIEDALKAEFTPRKGFKVVRVTCFEVTGERDVGDGTQLVGVHNGDVAWTPNHRAAVLSGNTGFVVENPWLNCSINELRALSAPGGVPTI